MKLKKLLTFGEQRGDFLAFVPGEARQQNYPSTVAYMAALLLDRYRVRGLVNSDLPPSKANVAKTHGVDAKPGELGVGTGTYCKECSTMSVHRQSGCKTCANCQATGECG